MQGSGTRAGGCFLTLFIILGFFYGLSIRNPLRGVLIGVGIGGWLADRWMRHTNRGRIFVSAIGMSFFLPALFGVGNAE